jgi:hypothetical protein
MRARYFCDAVFDCDLVSAEPADVLWVISILMPIAPSSRITIAALPIHMMRISLFSVFGSGWLVIARSSSGVRHLSAEIAASGLLTSYSYREAIARGHCHLYTGPDRSGADVTPLK